MNGNQCKIIMLMLPFDKALLSEAEARRELVERGSVRTELIRLSLLKPGVLGVLAVHY